MNSKEKVLQLEQIFNAVDHSVQQELDKRDSRVNELTELIELWCEYYTNGLPNDEVHDLYVDSLQILED